MPIDKEEFRSLAAKVSKASALLTPLVSCGCQDSHGGTAKDLPMRLTEVLVLIQEAGEMADGIFQHYQNARAEDTPPSLDMTVKQAKSLEEIRVRFGRENVSAPWLIILGEGSIMVRAKDIFIGIERDGYAHS